MMGKSRITVFLKEISKSLLPTVVIIFVIDKAISIAEEKQKEYIP